MLKRTNHKVKIGNQYEMNSKKAITFKYLAIVNKEFRSMITKPIML